MAKKLPTFEPHVVMEPSSVLGGRFGRMLVAAPTFCGVHVVERRAHIESQLGVVHRFIPTWALKHYKPPGIESEETSLQSVIRQLKEDSLAHGATPEAVVLLGSLSPFSEKELNIMAEKLQKKTSAAGKKPADKAKTAAPKAPKEKSAATDKSYKHLMTPAKAAEGARAGTWTARMLEIIMSHKSTADARAELAKDKDYSEKSLDFGWAAKKGFISTPA